MKKMPKTKKDKKIEPLVSLRTGFEPVREDPIGFQVQRLNHSAIAAVMRGGSEREKTFLITIFLLRCIAGYVLLFLTPLFLTHLVYVLIF